MTDKLAQEVEQLISENGLKPVIGAIARYCHSPKYQNYNQSIMATMFRRLNKLYEYLDKNHNDKNLLG